MAIKTAFLSSTGKDLTDWREAAYKAMEGLHGWHCVRMEDFGAADWDADEFCRAKVAECDVLIGIAGHLYGGVPKGNKQSYTEREYEAAADGAVPRLMFLAPEDFPLAANLVEPDDKREKQRAFRQRVNSERIRDTFTSPDDLARRVVQAIRNWEREQAALPTRSETARAAGVLPLPPQPYFAHPYPLQKNFTGRASERQMLTGWLSEDNHPVLALVAIGGMGKSAVTWAWLQRDVLGLPLPGVSQERTEVAEACRLPDDARPEGVLWWSFYEGGGTFAGFLEKALVYVSGGDVDLAGIPSTYEKVETLVNLLQQRRVLLVLDGLERELRAYASLSAAYQGDLMTKDVVGDPNSCTDPHSAEFLRRVASLPLQGRILLTSRLFPRELEGLAGCRQEELTGLEPEDAVLFLRAQGVKKGTRAEIQAACEPYGYLPLALRLLAGLIVRDKRSPGDVRVAERYPVLAELRGKEQHHILEVSYEALDGRKRALLSRIAAFRSPMSYEAVSVLNTYKRRKSFDAALDELVDRGLLQLDRETGRYDLHPIVRGYAYDRLTDKKGVHSRLRDYFAAVPAPDKDEVRSVEELAPVIELYHHTVGARLYDDACDLLYDRIAFALYYRFGAYQTRIELLRGLFPAGEDKPPRLKKEGSQAWTLNALAMSYARCGEARRSAALAERHIALDQRRGAKAELSVGLGNLATRQIVLGELAAADENLRHSIALCEEVGDEGQEAIVRLELGRLLAYEGNHAKSYEYLVSAQEFFDGLGAGRTNFVSVVQAYRALNSSLQRDVRAALAAARQARKLADDVARRALPTERDFVQAEWLIGWTLVALASESKSQRRQSLAEAEMHLTEALTRCRRINLVETEPDILLAWARWHRAKGNAEQARQHGEEALGIADRCEYRLAQADVHTFLAQMALDAGDGAGAREHAEVAKERAWCDGPPHCYKPALEEAQRLLEEAGSRS